MCPSCADIPEELLGIENWPYFVAWVHAWYTRYSDRKQLGACWARYSKYPLTREMWEELVMGAPTPDGL